MSFARTVLSPGAAYARPFVGVGAARRLGRAAAAALLLAATGGASGCVAGHLPSLRTERLDVRRVGPEGLTLRVRLSATNDRYSGTILVDALRIHVFVAGRDLGEVDVNQSWQLPPGQAVATETDISIPLPNLPEIAMAAASGPVPYHLDGNAHVQNVGWSVDFQYDGVIPREQILGAAAQRLPFGILP